ncbi:MAG: VWA domain-containing protein, partial [Polaribacter sp.]|nr:VWA domain-containing protein [Polaribacter sp.]
LEIINIDDFNNQLNDYQLIILYQPNNKFKNIVSQINQNKTNYLLFTGSNTDWNFINRNKLSLTKNAISESENYGAVFNDNFLTFVQEDIGFNNFPPLKDKFGEVKISKSHQTLLHQNINGIETQQPQLITSDLNNQKVGVIFGEGIWRWRAASYLNSDSFENFDKLIGNLIQYLASNKKRNRLEINVENIYPANSTINVSAFYTDKNYKFDARVSLELTVINLKTKKKVKVPFSLVNNSFQTKIADLSSGNYEYRVTVLEENISETGRFIITEFEIENQFTSANVEKLKKLANNSGGKLFYADQIDELTSELIKNQTFYTIQESTVKPQNLINWRWILFLVISLFTLEWFIRKYYGKI